MAKDKSGKTKLEKLMEMYAKLPPGTPIDRSQAPAEGPRTQAAEAARQGRRQAERDTGQPLPEGRSRTVDEAPAAGRRLTRADYDSLLASENAEAHNPNPFDFVFFSLSGPSLYSLKDIEEGQDLFSGFLEVEMKALTPVHIVGKQTPRTAGRKIGQSFFYREDGRPFIPGSSIRGMLRAFVEALTNGWVSQAQEGKEPEPAYPKVYGDPHARPRVQGRHLGFDSFKVTENTHGDGATSKTQPGIPPVFRPDRTQGIDVASYLFGLISKEEGLSLKHRVGIGDAAVSQKDLKCDCKMVDIESSAFMGGPHPSASNWWYLVPDRIGERHTRGHHVIELVGGGFWGRKFYYHQDPAECIDYYVNPEAEPEKWQHDEDRPLYQYDAECLDSGKTATFRISVKRLPKTMLDLLCLCLMPGANIRHKLGYGKQYGYGSVEFRVTQFNLRKESGPLDIKDDEAWKFNAGYQPPDWAKRCNLKIGASPIIKESALAELARVLGWPPSQGMLFTYPPYLEGFFKTPIRFGDDYSSLETRFPRGAVNEEKALDFAKALWARKKTIHFLLYQARSSGYRQILQRTP